MSFLQKILSTLLIEYFEKVLHIHEFHLAITAGITEKFVKIFGIIRCVVCSINRQNTSLNISIRTKSNLCFVRSIRFSDLQ